MCCHASGQHPFWRPDIVDGSNIHSLLLPYRHIRFQLILTQRGVNPRRQGNKTRTPDSAKFLAAFTQQLLNTLFTMGHEGLRDDDGDGKTITPYHMTKRITTYQDRDPYCKEFHKLIRKLGAEIDLRTGKVFTSKCALPFSHSRVLQKARRWPWVFNCARLSNQAPLHGN